MSALFQIPHLVNSDDPGPGWTGIVDTVGNKVKPIFKCACGQWLNMKKHHIHADGRVTASMLHPDCGFHEFMQLLDYTNGEFPPE